MHHAALIARARGDQPRAEAMTGARQAVEPLPHQDRRAGPALIQARSGRGDAASPGSTAAPDRRSIPSKTTPRIAPPHEQASATSRWPRVRARPHLPT